jgi:ABC-type branched-subunit amino acid transport system ATPase component
MVAAHRHAAPQWVSAALGLPGARRASVAQLDESLACLALVGLAPLALARAGDLPFGQQKLLEVARAVATRPRLLLLDEPAAGLHATEKVEMMALIGRLRARGIAILIIEHDMRLVMGVSDRVVVLDHGEKIAEGTPAEVQADPAVVRVYLGEDVDAHA